MTHDLALGLAFSFGYACCMLANHRVSRQREAWIKEQSAICLALIDDLRGRQRDK